MKKRRTFAFRLEPDQSDRLTAISTTTGLDHSTLIRCALSALIASFERSGGKLTLPITLAAVDLPAPTSSEVGAA